MKQKPTGLWRHVLRIPIHLYNWRMGFLFGERFALIDHVGRKTGRNYQTPLEVVMHDTATSEYVVCSGTGREADWFRNITASPAERIQVRNESWAPTQRILDQQESSDRFAQYEAAHPRAAKRLLKSMGREYDGTDAGRFEMMADLPMIAFSENAALR